MFRNTRIRNYNFSCFFANVDFDDYRNAPEICYILPATKLSFNQILIRKLFFIKSIRRAISRRSKLRMLSVTQSVNGVNGKNSMDASRFKGALLDCTFYILYVVCLVVNVDVFLQFFFFANSVPSLERRPCSFWLLNKFNFITRQGLTREILVIFYHCIGDQ